LGLLYVVHTFGKVIPTCNLLPLIRRYAKQLFPRWHKHCID